MANPIPQKLSGNGNHVVEDVHLGPYRIARYVSDVTGQRVTRNALVRPATNRKKIVFGAPHCHRQEFVPQQAQNNSAEQSGPPPAEASPVQQIVVAQASADEVPLTPDEIARLKDLKQANKTWKEIAGELKRSVGFLKDQWKLLRQENGQTQGQPQDQDQEQKKDQQKNQQKEKQNGKGQGTTKNGSNGSNPKGAVSIKVQLPEPDEHLNKREIKIMHAIIEDELPDFWLRVATAFYNATNRGIHPDDIKDTFTGLH